MKSRMPFGKFKNSPLDELPDDYLFWLLDLDNLRPALRLALEAERDRRRHSIQIGNFSSPLIGEILVAGYRSLAQKFHPDRGGDLAKMQELNVAMDEIRKHLGVAA